MADIVLDATSGVHRPRNVDWKRAAALLYGDWGTSKAYVIGLAFVAAGFSSLPIILAVCVLTGLVGVNYAVICRYFPDGGGVYSAARSQGRLLAVVSNNYAVHFAWLRVVIGRLFTGKLFVHLRMVLRAGALRLQLLLTVEPY